MTLDIIRKLTTHLVIYSEKKLCIGGCSLSRLAEQYVTPLYNLDELTIRTSCKQYS